MGGSVRKTIVDTGPLVAVFSRSDQHQRWAREEFARLEPPVLTCEAVLSEAQLLIEDRGGNALAVLELLARGVLKLALDVQSEVDHLLQLQRTYRDLPMSLADACLVRMTELHPQCRIMTTDSDFRIFRRNRRQLIPLLAPPWI